MLTINCGPGRQLCVYQLTRRQGSGEQGDSYVLALAYQHSLARSEMDTCIVPVSDVCIICAPGPPTPSPRDPSAV